MKPIKDVLDYPLLTEKSLKVRLHGNQWLFKAKPDATKGQIKRAIEDRFQVQVVSVNTVNVLGKYKSVRGVYGRRASWKKAYVRLREGDGIKEIE
jgi:large subunit ribosomal protein L23